MAITNTPEPVGHPPFRDAATLSPPSFGGYALPMMGTDASSGNGGGVRAAWPGDHVPRGRRGDGEGTNFSVFVAAADWVELVLVDRSGRPAKLQLAERTDLHWHGYVYGVGPGQHYGYRVHGRYAPAEGLRHNPNKLLIDPYARAIAGDLTWVPSLRLPLGGRRRRRDERAQLRGAHAPQRGRRPLLPLGRGPGDPTPRGRTRSSDENHVRGFTRLHPRRHRPARHLRLGPPIPPPSSTSPPSGSPPSS